MVKGKGDGAESGSGDCRTSNKIILTTRLNYTRGTNNNIWPARIPAINIAPGGGTALFALRGRFLSTARFRTLVFTVYLEDSPQLCRAKLWDPVVPMEGGEERGGEGRGGGREGG